MIENVIEFFKNLPAKNVQLVAMKSLNNMNAMVTNVIM